MNNVALKVHNINDFHKEGAGTKTVVLFSCALFLIFQFFYMFHLPREGRALRGNLDVLPERFLLTVPTDSFSPGFRLSQSVSFDSPDTSRLSPFFFNPVPINFCDKALLMSVRGIGPNLAQKILQARDRKGYFTNPEELLEIKGIGPARLSSLKQYLSFSKNHEHK